MRKNNLSIAAITAIAALSLTGCQFSGGSTQVTDNNGACTQVTVPSVNLAPVTAPTTLPGVVLAPCPTTSPPPTTAPPASDVTATATVLSDHQVRVDWTTTRTDITGWTLGRDGNDSGGSGPWSTELPAATRTLTFDLLVPGTLYHFTLTGHTATGNLTPVVVSATPTGTPPATTTTAAPPPTTTQAPPPPGATAAANFNWGTALPQSDEFNYTGAPDATKWDKAGDNPCWAGHAGNGLRCGANSTVANGYLRETGLANGATGWLASNVDQTTGRWEVRARMASDGGTGHPYHPVLITWPQSDQWPQGGEYDFMETDIGAPGIDAFMHHPTQSQVVQDHYSKTVDITQWHNYGFEWSTTGLTGYLDGVVWFHDTNSGIQAPGPMHLTVQLDNFFGSGMQPAHFDVDWAHIYKS